MIYILTKLEWKKFIFFINEWTSFPGMKKLLYLGFFLHHCDGKIITLLIKNVFNWAICPMRTRLVGEFKLPFIVKKNYFVPFLLPKVMVAYFCHHLSDNYVDLSYLYVVLSDLYVDLSDIYVDLSLIHLLENES